MMLGFNEAVIDIFTHLPPKKYILAPIDLDGASHLVPLLERFARVDALCDVHVRLDLIAQCGALQQVLSMALPTPELVRKMHTLGRSTTASQMVPNSVTVTIAMPMFSALFEDGIPAHIQLKDCRQSLRPACRSRLDGFVQSRPSPKG